ncbi:reverse transcriptase domain-containing protein [Tanacetum coccineum]
MALELANRSVTFPIGIAEDVIVKVKKFNFLVDFVIVDFEADPRVPIILGRPFLRTARALVDLYEEKLTLRVGNEEVVFYTDKSSRNNSRDMQSVHYINIIDFSKDKTSSGSTTPSDFVVESPCGDRVLFYHEEFADELAYIISPPEYDYFYFDLEADPGEFTRVLKENIFDFSTKGLTSIELNYSSLLLSDCDPSLSMEFFEIDPLVTFPSGNEDIVFDPGIISKESNLSDLKFH